MPGSGTHKRVSQPATCGYHFLALFLVGAIAAPGIQVKRVLQRWALDSVCTQSRLVETAMWRCKAIIGGFMRSHTKPSQKADVKPASAILNRMTQLGMPEGYCIS